MWFISFLTSALILLSVLLGAIVRISGSGLGCPDWPLCHGRIIPPADLAAWIEWLHRTSVAISSVFLVAFVVKGYRSYKRLWFFAPLLLLIAQVILGAITVKTEIHPFVSSLHTILAALYVSVTIFLACKSMSSQQIEINSNLYNWLKTCLVGLLLTIISGTVVTRSGASLVSRDMPIVVNFSEVPELFNLQLIQAMHRIIAYISFFVIMYYSHKIMKVHGLKLQGILITTLVTIQIAFGILNIISELASYIRILHIVFAFMLLAMVSFNLSNVKSSESA